MLIIAIVIVLIILLLGTTEHYDSLRAPTIYVYSDKLYKGLAAKFTRGQKILIATVNKYGLYKPIVDSLHLTIKNMARLAIYANGRKCLVFKTYENIPDLQAVIKQNSCAIAPGDSIIMHYESGA